jgi:hypothetical protein
MVLLCLALQWHTAIGVLDRMGRMCAHIVVMLWVCFRAAVALVVYAIAFPMYPCAKVIAGASERLRGMGLVAVAQD